MSRVQLSLNVSDLDEAIAFYARLFDTKPAKVRPGYARQHKTWVSGPDGLAWEYYTVIDHAETP